MLFLLALIALAASGCGQTTDRAGRAPRPSAASVPTGTVYLAGATPGELTVVDLTHNTARVRRLAQLAAGDPPHLIDFQAGRLVVFGHERTYAFDPQLHQPPRDLGESWFFLPSATPGRVWLALLDHHSPATIRALRAMREVTLTAKATLVRSRRPPRWPIAALGRGLVLQHSTLELWNPVSGTITRRLPGSTPVAVRDWRILSCAQGCRALHLTDTHANSHALIRPGPGFRFTESYDGAFSPTTAVAAVPATRTDGTPAVALIDLTHHTATLLAGPPLADPYRLMTWTSSGWLIYNTAHRHLAAYHPGQPQAHLLPVRVNAFVDITAR